MSSLQLDSKLPLWGLAGAMVAGVAAFYGVETRVTILATKAEAADKMMDEQVRVLKGVTASLIGFEKIIVQFDGRLEKIEWRLGELDKRIARQEPRVP